MKIIMLLCRFVLFVLLVNYCVSIDWSIHAPVPGTIVEKFVLSGQLIQVGQSLASILPDQFFNYDAFLDGREPSTFTNGAKPPAVSLFGDSDDDSDSDEDQKRRRRQTISNHLHVFGLFAKLKQAKRLLYPECPSSNRYILTSPVSGQIIEETFVVGDYVYRGELLYVIREVLFNIAEVSNEFALSSSSGIDNKPDAYFEMTGQPIYEYDVYKQGNEIPQKDLDNDLNTATT